MEKCKQVETPLNVNSKLLKLADEEFGNVQREMEGVLYEAKDMISHVCNGGHKGQYCVCGEYGKPIHVKGWSTALNGCETHHKVFKGHFGLQIMPHKQ